VLPSRLILFDLTFSLVPVPLFLLASVALRYLLFKKLNIELPYDPAIPLLGIYLKESVLVYSRGTCTPMFIAVLFTTAKLWKQPHY
jgi:hypothetical protein